VAVSVEFLVTAIAVVIGAVFLGERLSVVQLVGGAAIVLGCSLVLELLRVPSRGRAGVRRT
jgi:drug/metabolite transporter (DMT)-like permease